MLDRRSFLSALVLGITVERSGRVRAQTPSASPGPIGPIVTMPVDQLPGPLTEVWFMRFRFAPGAVLPEQEQAGPVLFFVESGELTMSSDAGVTGYSTQGNVEPLAAGTITVSAASDRTALLVPDRAHLRVTNEGSESASALVLLLMSGLREEEVMRTPVPVTETPEAEVGITSVGLALGRAEFGTGPGMIMIERVALKVGDTSPSNPSSIEAGAVESGKLDYSVSTGSGYVWQGIAQGGDRRINPVELTDGSTGTVSARDGYFFGLGTSAAITATADAVILRAVVTEQAAGTPTS
jgi:hypothetical protein